jgi:hypothetical protein
VTSIGSVPGGPGGLNPAKILLKKRKMRKNQKRKDRTGEYRAGTGSGGLKAGSFQNCGVATSFSFTLKSEKDM